MAAVPTARLTAPSALPEDPPRRLVEGTAILAAYALLFAVWGLTGGRFGAPLENWQLLPWPLLLDDLGRSLVDLHAQPPFLNLLLGTALKLSRATGAPAEALLMAVQLGVGAVAVLATWRLAVRLVHPRTLRVAAMAVLVLNPFLYGSLYVVFYTPWETMLLALGALCAARYLERPAPGRLVAALAPAIFLVHVRSLFHPLWLFLLGAALLVLSRRARSGRHVAAVALALVLACIWPVKNLVRFGFFGFSSWQGYNLAQGVPIAPPPLLGLFGRSAADPIDPRLARAAAEVIPAALRGRPALATLTKPDGSPNWNHYAVIPLCRDLGLAAVDAIAARPAIVAWKALDFYVDGYAVFEGRHAYDGGYVSELREHETWSRVYEAVVYQPFRPFDPSASRASTGFAIVLPLALAAILAALLRRTRDASAREGTVAVMLFSVSWVLLAVLLVDGAEGNRMRFPTMPLLVVSAAWALGAAMQRRRDARASS